MSMGWEMRTGTRWPATQMLGAYSSSTSGLIAAARALPPEPLRLNLEHSSPLAAPLRIGSAALLEHWCKTTRALNNPSVWPHTRGAVDHASTLEQPSRARGRHIILVGSSRVLG